MGLGGQGPDFMSYESGSTNGIGWSDPGLLREYQWHQVRKNQKEHLRDRRAETCYVMYVPFERVGGGESPAGKCGAGAGYRSRDDEPGAKDAHRGESRQKR